MTFQTVDPAKPQGAFRDFAAEARPGVKEFYRANHAGQTVDFVRSRHAAYLPLRRRRMGVWEAIALLSEVIDASDPDTDLTQLDHALQTAESLRRADAPRWLVLTGFIHDLGKVLCAFGEPQWAVVGDTFPVGCAFSDAIVFPELFAENLDARDERYGSEHGIYAPGCGLDRVLLSWGHDEYLYHVVRDHLPAPALAVIRYHSFYAWHREGAYRWLMDPSDQDKLRWVGRFNPHDLYSKSEAPPDLAELRPYYEALVGEFLPETLDW